MQAEDHLAGGDTQYKNNTLHEVFSTMQADTVNPSYPSHLYANIVSMGAADHGPEKANDREMFANDDRKTVEENQDLQRQLVFLQQQLKEKDRRIKCLEDQVATGSKKYSAGTSGTRQNSASQVLLHFLGSSKKGK